MRVYLIDPYTRTVTEASLDKRRGLDAYYEMLQCGTFDIAHVYGGDSIYVNDNGWEESKGFAVPGYPYVLTGRGIVTSHDDEGNDTPPRRTLDYYKNSVIWF